MSIISLMKHETGIWHTAFYSDARLPRAWPLRESLRRDRATWQRTINGIGKTATRDRIRSFFVNRLYLEIAYIISVTALKLSARASRQIACGKWRCVLECIRFISIARTSRYTMIFAYERSIDSCRNEQKYVSPKHFVAF